MTKFSVILYLFSLLTIQAETKKILFLGDSLTAGFGISKDKAFPALIQKKIDAKKLDYSIINAGLSGETTAGGARRIKWLLKQKVDILFVCLGGNDGLRGIQSKSSKGNLLKIISIAQKKGITVVLGGMLAAPNMGPDYAKEFKQIY
ncbi:MAG: arylesterase, partial [Lentisphaeria bacterium]|nr:arylesterase [Lentisphaeria bacterium]